MSIYMYTNMREYVYMCVLYSVYVTYIFVYMHKYVYLYIQMCICIHIYLKHTERIIKVYDSLEAIAASIK